MLSSSSISIPFTLSIPRVLVGPFLYLLLALDTTIPKHHQNSHCTYAQSITWRYHWRCGLSSHWHWSGLHWAAWRSPRPRLAWSAVMTRGHTCYRLLLWAGSFRTAAEALWPTLTFWRTNLRPWYRTRLKLPRLRGNKWCSGNDAAPARQCPISTACTSKSSGRFQQGRWSLRSARGKLHPPCFFAHRRTCCSQTWLKWMSFPLEL